MTNPVVIERSPHDDVSSFDSFSTLTTSPVVMQKLLANIAIGIVFPGAGIHEWIQHQNEGSSVKIELPIDWYNMTFWDLLSNLFLNIFQRELYAI